MLVVLSATLMLVDLFVAVMAVLQTSEFYWPSENVKVVKVRTGCLGGALSSLLGFYGAKTPPFSLSKDARLAKTDNKILLYKLADLSLILKKKTGDFF